ncbi:flagellar assembly protein FliW [Sporosarcina aquimarina]|uniref:Flagellar assembly factor FliW n=1 Tax=Sporosarcina aquimarina TaxID=114975 RepID=A0ABU4G1G4_9BACL|nr:flagellar assembly protein FliW [Sporosarcina aquimarina]MDW0110811.1 flagellar assembly protein FliW [Sporosarcina aquimarina]
MTIQTKFHGEIPTEELTNWTFPNGLPGLEDEKQFVILPIEGNDIFQVLQSVNNSNVALIVSNPYTLINDYSFEIDEPTIDLLEIKSPEDVMVLAVMSLKQPFESSTINLQAPLIFNINNQKAKQMIMNDATYQLRQPIGQPIVKGAR